MQQLYFSSMSNQVKMIAGVVIAFAVIGVGAFVLTKQSKPQETTPTTMTTPDDSTTRGSIKGLLGTGKNVTCQITYPDGNGNGTIYVADNKVRGDFTVNSLDNVPTQSNLIYDSEFAYIWTGTTGTKVKIDPADVASATESADTELDKEVDLKCSDWSPDNSKFEVPKDVTFTDLSQTLQQDNNAACAQITDPQAKAACLKATGQ